MLQTVVLNLSGISLLSQDLCRKSSTKWLIKLFNSRKYWNVSDRERWHIRPKCPLLVSEVHYFIIRTEANQTYTSYFWGQQGHVRIGVGLKLLIFTVSAPVGRLCCNPVNFCNTGCSVRGKKPITYTAARCKLITWQSVRVASLRCHIGRASVIAPTFVAAGVSASLTLSAPIESPIYRNRQRADWIKGRTRGGSDCDGTRCVRQK